MTFVVTVACIRCKYANCVEACPAHCFFAGPDFVAIESDDCIDRAARTSECRVNAIHAAAEVPFERRHMIRHHAEWPIWERITRSKSASPDADQRKGKTQKLQELMH